MFLELAVNQSNELCSLDSHFYEGGKPKMHVLKNCLTTEDKPFKVHEFLYIVYPNIATNIASTISTFLNLITKNI